jgi:hypothetical protein
MEIKGWRRDKKLALAGQVSLSSFGSSGQVPEAKEVGPGEL